MNINLKSICPATNTNICTFGIEDMTTNHFQLTNKEKLMLMLEEIDIMCEAIYSTTDKVVELIAYIGNSDYTRECIGTLKDNEKTFLINNINEILNTVVN